MENLENIDDIDMEEFILIQRDGSTKENIGEQVG